MCSASAGTDKNGKNSDPAAGVSSRIVNKVLDSGHVDTRIVWVRIAGPVCNAHITAYIPRKGRKQKPIAQDTIAQPQQLMRTIPKSDYNVGGRSQLPTPETHTWIHGKMEHDGKNK